MDAARALAQIDGDEVALLDCMTFWLTNQMLQADLSWSEELDVLCDVLAQLPCPVVLVSNDVSGGVVPETSLGRAFRNAQGATNQRLARLADLVVLVTAGLPQVLKGTPPEEAPWP